VLSQESAIAEWGWENRFRAGRFTEQQVSLSEITELARVTFHQSVLDADPLATEPDEGKRRSLRTLEDLRLR
jgi:hypothetical protein